tara:strand:- start:22 stop:1632 length:1611 start_codon:yes stop_codon:yes gene_type:complete
MQRIKNNEFGYLGNASIKRDGVVGDFTKEEVLEYQKCMQDPVYFAKNYIKIISLDEGLVPFDLYPYQEKMFRHFNDNRFSIVLACRQSGKSISSVVYLLWYACFHPEKTIAILANKGAVAREMLARITLALENLPFFLQPGTKVLNKGSIEFSNNSRIIASATSGSSIRGLSINLLFLDEFAFVENDAEFYTSTYPVVSAGTDTQIIVTSTANGIGNVYHKLWEGAMTNTNEFKSFRVDWWDVPGRDEKWKEQTIANTSALQFEQEFGNTFHGRGNTLIAADHLLAQKAIDPIHFQENLLVYKEPIEGHDYIMTVDTAKGRGQDYSTFTIIDVSTEPFEQAVVFRDNNISPMLMPDIIYRYAKTYNEAYVIVESNDQGVVVCNGLYYDLEYENMFVESAVKKNAIGATMTRRVKRIGCSTIKDLIEQKKLMIYDAQTIIEMSTFVSRGKTFMAIAPNHDDLMMNLVLFAWFTTTDIFTSLSNIDMKNMLYKEQLQAIQDDMIPFGIIDDGQNENKGVGDGEGNVWFEEDTKTTGLF